MAVTYSEMIELGTEAPSFDLPATNPAVDERGDERRSLADYEAARAVVVVFTCNHCPYARHVEDALVQMARDEAARGVQFIAISPNDPAQYPQDAPDQMARRAREKGYPFPYLYDETQEVARAYGAVCTPDFFLFDADRRLVYRGRFDESRPGQGQATGRELKQALDELLDTGRVAVEQVPSMGCNIKWRENA